MKRGGHLISATVFAAAWISFGAGCATSPTSPSPETIHPDVSASKGGSRSERAGDVPLPKGSASSGTVEEGQAAKP